MRAPQGGGARMRAPQGGGARTPSPTSRTRLPALFPTVVLLKPYLSNDEEDIKYKV